MKFLYLLLSICLFLLCTPWTTAETVPTIAPPNPTPPNGAPVEAGSTTGFPGPQTAAPTKPTPTVTTIYPIY
ncbi:uncharacterized protein LOC111070691 [Drosophila obscura]|uniref:uncharacterized protein LOC111070691 n=1 Tax=Drosophila obscura TaxID=7282 RepID=UPI000BA0B7E3|nr:uncharacterized protein LOC111070691 [Drosophila obscura]